MSILVFAFALGVAQFTAVPGQKSDYSAKDTRDVVREYGDCIVRRHEQTASRAILADADNHQLRRDYPYLFDNDCLSFKEPGWTLISFEGDQFRYIVADALVRAEFAKSAAPNLTNVAPLSHGDPGAPPASLDSRGKPVNRQEYDRAIQNYRTAEAFTFLSRYGECVVRADPAAARALILAMPNSPEEASQFAAMQTSLGACLAAGQQLKFGKLDLRGTIAVNYYRLAKAAAGAAQP
jgi:hypothetical protein